MTCNLNVTTPCQDGEEQARARRRLNASVTFMGMARVDGDLDPESGEALATPLQTVLDAESRSPSEDRDSRAPWQRRADALGEICQQWLDIGDRPNVGGESELGGAVSFRSSQLYPIAPSIWSSIRRFSSTAYSMGSSRVMGSMNPFTIMAVASTSVSPRLIR
jgi:Domain of unknown function (DUF222)